MITVYILTTGGTIEKTYSDVNALIDDPEVGIVDIAVKGAELIKQLADARPETDWIFQYSPESFTGTELDFAVEICDAVTAVWQPTPFLAV